MRYNLSRVTRDQREGPAREAVEAAAGEATRRVAQRTARGRGRGADGQELQRDREDREDGAIRPEPASSTAVLEKKTSKFCQMLLAENVDTRYY